MNEGKEKQGEPGYLSPVDAAAEIQEALRPLGYEVNGFSMDVYEGTLSFSRHGQGCRLDGSGQIVLG